MIMLQAVQDHLGTWIPQVQGQYINEDWNPTNQGLGAQCWDLAANWSKRLGLPVINTGYTGRWVGWAGNMVAAYPQSPEIAAAYELIGPDQPGLPGLPGDIAVWGDSFWYYPATHVAVLVADKGLQKLCMSQNSTPPQGDNPYPVWSSGPATLQYLPAQGLIGYLRPRTGLSAMGTITPTEEYDMAELSEGSVQAIADRVIPVITTLLDQYHGVTRANIINELSKKMDDETYEMQVFNQHEFNPRFDQVIIDGRVQEAITRSEIQPAQLADLIPADVAQAVIDALVKKLGATA